jgi:hypothetical protein
VVVTVASAKVVRCAGAALRAAVIRIAVTAGLTLLACVFGAAVANATTSSDASQPNTAQPGDTADSLRSDLSDLVNGLLKSFGSHRHHAGLGAVSAIAPPADDSSGTGSTTVTSGGPSSAGDTGAQGSSGGGWGGGSDSGDTWTGTTTVTVPTKPTPPQPPAPPAPPAPVQQTAAPVKHAVEPVVRTNEPSMGAPGGTGPDVPQQPVDLPLQQPAAQPISAPATGGSAGHDLGSANGLAGIVTPGTGFRPSPGSSSDEPGAKRVSDGVPGLPSTSPD